MNYTLQVDSLDLRLVLVVLVGLFVAGWKVGSLYTWPRGVRHGLGMRPKRLPRSWSWLADRISRAPTLADIHRLLGVGRLMTGAGKTSRKLWRKAASRRARELTAV